ncbi:two-component system, NtrC family, C4-dicarboxylate transport response regulator DctD [Modicisalibacter muralis]|uniref:Two-component system, NtrC family, C4-dicarboxylate transport response regulator DctD n=1 Tax=Modicisalibacter muralis TaxID=119000 RepID=A0A1G9K0Y2_9GAMM|nr:sigma-54 dependent transcriptional regulator [Halomonas muralis]SDL43014.1 two-component system, NtrC family, C4-dicarboxylate transport response regulator DctD [Halomonas muralis]
MSELPVWLVDDDPGVRESLSQWFELSDLPVRAFAAAGRVLEALDDGASCGVLVSDVKMPGLDGLALLRAVQAADPGLPVLLITGHGDVPMAVEAMREGAWDFIEKPFAPERLEECVRRALERRRLTLENDRLRRALRQGGLASRLLGEAPGMQRLRDQLGNLAPTRANVVVQGETGSGKEVVARCLHDFGPGHEAPFVALNCGAIAPELIESELFGHHKGAFTGAVESRVGKLEYASGGTLFLDEIESMPLAAQVKLLRALQEGEITRLGSNDVIAIDLRVVAASKVGLLALAARGEFREDLYYRLAIAELHVPPLRERREDIAMLFAHFCRQAAEVHQRPLREPGGDLLAALGRHAWPGNLRELRNVATRFTLGLDVPQLTGQEAGGDGSLGEQVAAFEATLLRAALGRHGGNIQAILDELELPRRTLNQKMQKYGLRREAFLDTRREA